MSEEIVERAWWPFVGRVVRMRILARNRVTKEPEVILDVSVGPTDARRDASPLLTADDALDDEDGNSELSRCRLTITIRKSRLSP